MKNSDKIFVLKNGRLIAEGTHNSLLENEEYASLYKNMLNEESKNI